MKGLPALFSRSLWHPRLVLVHPEGRIPLSGYKIKARWSGCSGWTRAWGEGTWWFFLVSLPSCLWGLPYCPLTVAVCCTRTFILENFTRTRSRQNGTSNSHRPPPSCHDVLPSCFTSSHPLLDDWFCFFQSVLFVNQIYTHRNAQSSTVQLVTHLYHDMGCLHLPRKFLDGLATPRSRQPLI